MIPFIPMCSPREKATYYEYAVKVGGTILSRKRYDNVEDAKWECLLGNSQDRERTGRVLVKREVVKRKVTIGDWIDVDVDKEMKKLEKQKKKERKACLRS